MHSFVSVLVISNFNSQTGLVFISIFSSQQFSIFMHIIAPILIVGYLASPTKTVDSNDIFGLAINTVSTIFQVEKTKIRSYREPREYIPPPYVPPVYIPLKTVKATFEATPTETTSGNEIYRVWCQY